MKNRLFLSFSYIAALTLTACGLTNSNKLELIHFGRVVFNEQPEESLRPFKLAEGAMRYEEKTYLNYGESFVVEAQVKNEDRYSFVDIVLYSRATNEKYVFNEGNGLYQCSVTTVNRDGSWITDITIPIDFSLVNSTSSCYIETALEIEEITFLNLSGGNAQANIKKDFKKLSIEYDNDQTTNPHNWVVDNNNGEFVIECTNCHHYHIDGNAINLDEENDAITYGFYPQTHVGDEQLIEKLNSLTAPLLGNWYFYNGGLYVKSENGYSVTYLDGTISNRYPPYWFNVEPIEWKILSRNAGEYLVISKLLLDAHEWNNSSQEKVVDGQTIYQNNYEYSSVREWLNNDFYNTAFALGNTYIKTTTVDNSAATTDTTNNTYVCNNTQDKVFLPSYQDLINVNYGFESTTGASNTKTAITTDWARNNRGFYVSSNHRDRELYLNNGYYWLRSPLSNDKEYAWSIDYDGHLSNQGRIYYSDTLVRPALTLTII